MKNKDNIKVLIFPSWYPTKFNKISGIFVKEQVIALKRNHINANVFYPVIKLSYKNIIPRIYMEEKIVDGIKTYFLNIKFFKIPKCYNILFLIFSYFYLKKLIIKEKYNIIHSYVLFPSGIIASLISKKYNIPFIVSEMASDFNIFYKRSFILFYFVKKVVLKCNRLITVSSLLGKQILKNGITPKKMKTIYTIADENLFFYKKRVKKKSNKINFLFTGLLNKTEQKGVHILIEAIKLINKEYDLKYNFQITVVGDGVMRKVYQDRIKKYKINKYFNFLGNKTLKEIAFLMQSCDIFILPSLHEGMPCVIVEALSCGMPIVASKVGGIPEVVKNFSGVLAKPDDVKDLKKKIQFMLKNYKKFNNKKIENYAKDLFSYRIYYKKILKEYQDIIYEFNKCNNSCL